MKEDLTKGKLTLCYEIIPLIDYYIKIRMYHMIDWTTGELTLKGKFRENNTILKKLLWRVLFSTVTNYKTRQGLIIDGWNALGGININNRCFY